MGEETITEMAPANEAHLEQSEELKNLITFLTDNLSKELPTLVIDADYFFLGMMIEKNNDLYRRLDGCLLSSAMENLYRSFYSYVSSKALTAVKNNRKAIIGEDLAKLFERAEEEAKEMNASEVTTEHVFLAILSDDAPSNKIRRVFNGAGINHSIMKSKMNDSMTNSEIGTDMGKGNGKQSVAIGLPTPNGGVRIINMGNEVDANTFINNIMHGNAMDGMEEPMVPGARKKGGKNANVKEFCANLNDLAKGGKIDPLVGRDREMEEIIRILGRKKKNNAILLGGEGVGKTAIGEALAYKIVNNEVPEFLSNKVIVSLDMTALMAGTTLRGMFEERVKGILDDIKKDSSFILFMDNIGAILADKGKNDYEISSMLSRALENGEVQVIGTSDYASYRKTFDKDPSLARRFQKIIIEAPSVEESYEILRGLQPSYEEFHKVKYTDDAVVSCVDLAHRYITERNLPDSAIDIMDEVGAQVGIVAEDPSLKAMRLAIIDKEAEMERDKANKEYTKADIDNVLIVKMKQNYIDAKDAYAKTREENPIMITRENILEIVSKKTGIPINSLSSDDKKRLANINERLKETVIGQDEAIDKICKALKRNRIGLHKNGCMYSAIAIGKTGVGKTFIAKQLAKELFGDEKAIVRFDMSEFSDKVAVNKLIGSNPGYVGYEEGGQLTEKIKNRKYCVLLLDEIEKADPEIYNIFLQVLDEGFLTDNTGQKVDFSNVIVLFTSNVGAKAANDFGRSIGLGDSESDNTQKILLKELKNKFPPEFLNRLDDVIYFNSLTDDNLKTIIRNEMNNLKERIITLGYDMEYDDSAIDFIFDIVKKKKEFGARPILRAIQDTIENGITDALLEKDYENGYMFKVSCSEGDSDTKRILVA